MYFVIISILFILLQGTMSGQKKRVLADQAYDLMHYSEAIELYESYYKSSRDSSALQKIGVCYLKNKNYKKAQQYFGKCLNHIKSNPIIYLKYAELLFIQGLRDSSASVLDEYITMHGVSPATDRLTSSISAYDSLMINNGAYEMNPTTFNSNEGDFSPVYYSKQILFSSQRSGKMDAWTGKHFAALYMVEEDGSDIKEIPIEFAENHHRASFSFSDARFSNLSNKSLLISSSSYTFSCLQG